MQQTTDKSKLLSVIVPMYNVEAYVDKCLDSFNHSEWKDRVEVLIINDGSTDHSREIAERYQKWQPKIYRIIDKENGGHGSAINRGIQEAQGRYFKVVDSDDWVEDISFSLLLDKLQRFDADAIITRYHWVNDISGKRKEEKLFNSDLIEYEKIYSLDQLPIFFPFKMHALIFKTAILKKMPYRLDEHCFYVDMEYVMFPFPYIRRVIFFDLFVYEYRIGQKNQSVSVEMMRKRYCQHQHVLLRLLHFFKNEKEALSVQSKKSLAFGISRMAVSHYRILLSFPPSYIYKGRLQKWERMLIRYFPDIYHSMSNPAIVLLRRTNYHFYYIVSRVVGCFYK